MKARLVRAGEACWTAGGVLLLAQAADFGSEPWHAWVPWALVGAAPLLWFLSGFVGALMRDLKLAAKAVDPTLGLWERMALRVRLWRLNVPVVERDAWLAKHRLHGRIVGCVGEDSGVRVRLLNCPCGAVLALRDGP